MLVVIAMLLSILALVPAAQAALPAPSGLSPANGTAVDGIPTFSWDRVPTATGYNVELYTSPDFSTTANRIATATTVNVHWVPSMQIPTSTVWWRVRANTPAGATDWSSASFSRSAPAAPVLQSPVDAVNLQQPQDAVRFRWSPVPGATSYRLEISQDQQFTDPARITTYTSRTTTYTPNLLQAADTYYWRVTAILASGIESDTSAPRSYTVVPPSIPTQPVQPADGATTTVRDVVLEWQPVAGAAKYNLQISTDPNFQTTVHTRTGILGTRYSPPNTLDNDQYYWRVTPVNASGVATDWNVVPIWQFHRSWTDQPSLEYPNDGATVSKPLFYQWTPATLASRYQVQISQDPSFQDGTTQSCADTVHTTYTPNGSCLPAQGKITYWRVLAYDDPTNVKSEFLNAEVHSFIYLPEQVNLLAPADGAQVDIPTLSWEPYDGAKQYRVTITPDGGSARTYTTSSTSFTPTSALSLGTYRWQVQPVNSDGQVGLSLALEAQQSFTVVAQTTPTASAPDAVSPSSASLSNPTLTWRPVVNATSYKIRYRASGAVSWTAPTTSYAYPAGEIAGNGLTPGSYDWQAIAYNGSTQLSVSSNVGAFTIASIGTVTGYRAAITGTDLAQLSTSCTAGLPAECQDIRQTPVLHWNASAGAAYYKLYISRDDQLTNLQSGFPITVNSTVWMDPAALPDSDAGSAYYWFVQPCNLATCAPLGQAQHAFNKLSNPVQLVSPGYGSEQQNAVTLHWQDYLNTESSAGTGDSSLSTPARTEAKNYRVQVATDPQFTKIVDTQTVDQTELTSFATTYPEGPVYWRVQAVDGSGNYLPWSSTGALCPGAPSSVAPDAACSFLKYSPAPKQVSPAGGDTVSGSSSFDWAPQDFAATYNVEIYSAAGTKVAGGSGLKQVSFTPSVPLPTGQGYTWRLQRVDGSGRAGAWSADVKFNVNGAPPIPQNPGSGAVVEPRGAVFQWQPPSDDSTVASYRFTARSSSGAVMTVDTPATAWAPTAAMGGGGWTWTVATLDTGGKVIATSDPVAFTVQASPSADVTITGTGKVGTDLAVEPVNWDLDGVTTTYQWYVGTSKVSGATAGLYRVQAKDLGKDIYVKAAGTKPGYDTGTAASNTIRAVAGDALAVISSPKITGTRAVGHTLTASPGSWAGSSTPTYTYQWLRGGAAITGATKSTYTLSVADAARQVSVRVTAHATAMADGTATSAAVVIAKLGTHTKLALVTAKIRRTAYPKATVTVGDSYGVRPTGTVRVYSGSRLVKSATLRASQNGKVTVTLPKQAVGRHAISARYLGNWQLAASRSTSATLTVVR